MARTKLTAIQSTVGKRPMLVKAKTASTKKSDGANHPAPRRMRRAPGVAALKEIRKYQSSTKPLMRKKPFQRLVREITRDQLEELSGDVKITDARFQSAALDALQELSEMYVVHLFEDSNLEAVHAKRVTVMTKDVKIARHVRGDEAKLGKWPETKAKS
jgi:histone H3